MISFYYNGLKFIKIYKHLACLQPTYSYFASSSNILINSLILVPSVEIELCSSNPVGIYMFKFNNRNTRTRCAICSKLTIKIPGTCFTPYSSVSVVNFELVNADWEKNKSLINMLNKNWLSTDLWRTPESSSFSFLSPSFINIFITTGNIWKFELLQSLMLTWHSISFFCFNKFFYFKLLL